MANTVTFSRKFCMPTGETFSMPPVSDLLFRWLPIDGVIVDPFARNSKWGTITNDLSLATTAANHMHAEDFVSQLKLTADAVLFDPPYSPRQVKEVYQQVGLACCREDTQNARMYRAVKDGLAAILRPGGIAVCCGWNSIGFGKSRGFSLMEVLLVTHGGAHNDTIVTVERKE